MPGCSAGRGSAGGRAARPGRALGQCLAPFTGHRGGCAGRSPAAACPFGGGNKVVASSAGLTRIPPGAVQTPEPGRVRPTLAGFARSTLAQAELARCPNCPVHVSPLPLRVLYHSSCRRGVLLPQPFPVVPFGPLWFGCAARLGQILSSKLQSLGNPEKGLSVQWSFFAGTSPPALCCQKKVIP